MDLQEKFQVTLPGKIEGGEGWADFEAQRRVYPEPHLCMPYTQIVEHVVKDHGMPLSLAGATDVTDNVNQADLKRGYDLHAMQGTDDQYTGEHVDHFYGDAGGFVERNNYLDRM